MPRPIRRPSHAGSWYDDDGEKRIFPDTRMARFVLQEKINISLKNVLNKRMGKASRLDLPINLTKVILKGTFVDFDHQRCCSVENVYSVRSCSTEELSTVHRKSASCTDSDMDQCCSYTKGCSCSWHHMPVSSLSPLSNLFSLFISQTQIILLSPMSLLLYTRHAGYRYCGHVMAHAYKQINPDQV